MHLVASVLYNSILQPNNIFCKPAYVFFSLSITLFDGLLGHVGRGVGVGVDVSNEFSNDGLLGNVEVNIF